MPQPTSPSLSISPRQNRANRELVRSHLNWLHSLATGGQEYALDRRQFTVLARQYAGALGNLVSRLERAGRLTDEEVATLREGMRV